MHGRPDAAAGPLRSARGARQVRPASRGREVMSLKAIAFAIALTATSGALAGAQALPPIPVSALPHIVIFSPEFYWSNTPDIVRMASATCPQGPRDRRRLEHPAGQRIAAHPGQLSGRRLLGGAVRGPSTPGRRTARADLAGSRLRALPAAGVARFFRAARQLSAAAAPVATASTSPRAASSTTGRQACPEGALVDLGRGRSSIRRARRPPGCGWS